MRKEGPIYDLPIAVGVLIASEQIEDRWGEAVFLGELSLDGGLRHVNGVLPLVAMCAERGIDVAVVPGEDLAEARMVAGVQVHGLTSLSQLKTDPASWETPASSNAGAERTFEAAHDIAVVQGQEHVKRAFEVAAAGGHNIMLQGPPGSGKTLLARAMPGLLPPLTPPEALEVTKVYSVAGMIARDQPLILERPFRAPHHTVSHAGLVGGGSKIRPGEVSLAHRGVLFLDEFPEFSAVALESLREPLESGVVTITRVRGSVAFPAVLLLIAAMNP